MKEITVYARAGQGAITTAVIVGGSYFKEDKFAYAFPHFGAARMGAPMNAFIRVDENPIRMRSKIYNPDYALVIDATLMKSQDVFSDTKDGGIVIINSGKEYELDKDNIKIFTIPANQIALEVIGRPLGNTAVLGAFAAISKEITIESLESAILERFKGEIGEKNAVCAHKGYQYALDLKANEN
ncbi:MAG: 2-oxoacid:acceptor oxidoreductase family protein [Candidatus Saelkia tenebricola]|nr:2-oxoacid:acceptor oxidoreductase family protein [Candidatus Saelkia tenebricola]